MGTALPPQLNDASAERKWPAITTHNQGNHAIRTEEWRFIRYADGSKELYDLKHDPHEHENLAGKPRYRQVIEELSQWLPNKDVGPVPGMRQPSADPVRQNAGLGRKADQGGRSHSGVNL